jgi:hypothetical protein
MLLIELSKCKLVHKLDEILKNLPVDLFAVYDRFFESLSSHEWVYVDAVLRWIMFSFEPLTLDQLSDAIAFDFSGSPEFYAYKPDQRRDNTEAIRSWLDGLVVVRSQSILSQEPAVQLSHASVQGYLLSDHFTSKFGRANSPFSKSLSHMLITRACIGYFLYFADHLLNETNLANFPLGGYAAVSWCHHLLCCDEQTILFDAAMRLLKDGSRQFDALTRFTNQGSFWLAHRLDSPLQFCVRNGCIEGIKRILANNPDSVNLVGQTSGTTVLAIACDQGRTDIAILLLQNGAQVNLRCPFFESALQIAAFGDRHEIVQLLLQHGAAADLEDWGKSLMAASHLGNSRTAGILLGGGVDINKAGAYYERAVEAAGSGGVLNNLMGGQATENLQASMDLLLQGTPGGFSAALSAAKRGGIGVS